MRSPDLICAWLLFSLNIPLGWAQTEAEQKEAEQLPAVVTPTGAQDALHIRRPLDSAFSGYRSYDPYPEGVEWRAANDEVGRLKGYAGHMQPRTGNGAPMFGPSR